MSMSMSTSMAPWLHAMACTVISENSFKLVKVSLPTVEVKYRTEAHWSLIIIINLKKGLTSVDIKLDNNYHYVRLVEWPHHMVIQDHVTITSHCAIGGNVVIKEQAFIGLNSSLRNNITIGKCAIIGTSANVVKDVEAYSVMLGNPAKPTGVKSSNLNL